MCYSTFVCSDTDAKKLLEEALDNGSLTPKVSHTLFIGSTKKMILDRSGASVRDNYSYYVVENEEVKRLQPVHLESFFAYNAAFPVKLNVGFQSAKVDALLIQQLIATTSENENKDPDRVHNNKVIT